MDWGGTGGGRSKGDEGFEDLLFAVIYARSKHDGVFSPSLAALGFIARFTQQVSTVLSCYIILLR